MDHKGFSKYLKDNHNILNLNWGEYKILEPIGQGGNGMVYKASISGHIVALKILIPSVSGATLKEKLDRFKAEYFNIVTIENPKNIVRYINYDILHISNEEGELELPIITMKCYDSSLKKNHKPFNEKEFFQLYNFLLDTVEHIHELGIIHRDIKPENILRDNTNFVLADFGIASYNPEIFKIRANTRTGERLGNRLFSAPEQENANTKPAKTMDIYAIGQVLQWFATGETHRGTGRESIPGISEALKIIDMIIDKCLSHDPKDRFQSIQEIRDFSESQLTKDPFQYLENFNEICRKHFPKSAGGIVYSDNRKKIDCLFSEIKNQLPFFDKTLWWYAGNRHLYINNIKYQEEGIWLINGIEYAIKEIWVNFNSPTKNDFLLIHHVSRPPFVIDDQTSYYVAIVDDTYMISGNESENGFAEINGETIDLSQHKVQEIKREYEDGYFFICNYYHCLFQPNNTNFTIKFIDDITKGNGDITKDLRFFAHDINKHTHPDIVVRL